MTDADSIAPLSRQRLAVVLGELHTGGASVADLRWQEAPDDVRVEAVCLPSGAVVAYLAERAGQWWSRHWSKPMGSAGPPPPPGVILEPAQEIARATIAAAETHSRVPQPRTLMGVLEDGLVFAADGLGEVDQALDNLWPAMREWTMTDRPVAVDGFADGFAGSAIWLAFGVAEWGAFPHAIPRDQASRLLQVEGVRTVLMRSIDAHSDGPTETLIANRDAD